MPNPVTQSESERALQEVLAWFYGSYFTGAPVTLAGRTVTLPVCDLAFNRAAPPQPAEKVQIHTIFSDRKRIKTGNGPTDLSLEKITATIYVRASNSLGSNAEYQSRRIADALLQMFESEDYALSQKNVRHAQVLRGPIPLPTPLMQTRMLVVSLQLNLDVAR